MLKVTFSGRRWAAALSIAAVTTALVAPSGGCSSADAGTSCKMSSAYQPAYQSFHSWTAFSFDCQDMPGSPHPAGPCTVYINPLPAAGATSFAVGTIIVKEFHNGSLPDGGPNPIGDTVLAMNKKGCDYNSGGAAGWQWAQLDNVLGGGETLVWSDVVSPANETYLNTGQTCNQCHAAAKSNDYVQSPPLQLSVLEAWAASHPNGEPDDAGASSGDSGAADSGTLSPADGAATDASDASDATVLDGSEG